MTGPTEGIYLDAKLAVIGQQVEERIDGIQGGRRRAVRLGVAVLGLLALGGGAATAAALSYPPPAVVIVEVPVSVESLRCVDGDDPSAAAYFTVRYAVPTDEADSVDPVTTCAAAHVEAADLDPAATPEELLAVAGRLLADASAADRDPVVRHATFGEPAASSTGAAWTVCSDDAGSTVLRHDPDVAPACPGGRG